MKELRTIILAAGKGTRMKSDRPKVLHPVCGKKILEYVLDAAKEIGSSKVYVVVGHKKQQIQDFLRQKNQVYPVVQKRMAGTADAIKSAKATFSRFTGNVLILSGDAILLKKQTLKNLIHTHVNKDADCTFLTSVIHEPYGYGRIIRSQGGKAVAIREEKDAVGYEKSIAEINVGVYCFKSPVLFKMIDSIKLNPVKKEYYLTDMIALLAEKKMRIETCEVEDSSEGFGINTRVDLTKAEKVMRQRILQDLMLSGVTVVDPQTTYIHHDVKIGRDTVVHPFTVIEGNVRIGSQCSIGPFAHLRPGTKVRDKACLGNFVEVSRTFFGKESIMKHFGFLGDAHVGTNVNIGAGTVTANYDGKNKNKTQIADHAFIGSDSILVAPLKIGKRAVTGAGCVVPGGRNVAMGKVVAGVPAKEIKRSRTHKGGRS